MCCTTYLVEVYVVSYMSWSVKESFTDIWILTSIVIEKYHIRDIAPNRGYCEASKFHKVYNKLYQRHGT